MVRIFTDPIRIRFGLEGFLSVCIRFRVSNNITNPYPNAQKLYFYDVDIHYNLIRQKLTLFVSVFKHKYKNKYDISNIRFYFETFTSLFFTHIACWARLRQLFDLTKTETSQKIILVNDWRSRSESKATFHLMQLRTLCLLLKVEIDL